MKKRLVCNNVLSITLLLIRRVQAIFPAPKFEDYSSNSLVTLTFEPSSLQVQQAIPSHAFMDKAIQRFVADSTRALPNFAADYPLNPDQMQLQELRIFRFIRFDDSTELNGDTDESYLLEINSEMEITSQTVFGAIRALETLSQLLQFGWLDDLGKPTFIIHHTPLSIRDSPTFPYRGLLIDTARHYLPVSLILANVDAMARNKLNVLHWHMTDDQSWPYQSSRYPDLSDQGAYHPKRIYSPGNVTHIIREAHLRGIRVIPEFDMPGHTYAMAKSHPDIMSHCPDAVDPMDPTQEATFDFIEQLYQEIAGMFHDDYMHLGGDEVALDCWENDTSIQQWMQKNKIDNVVDLFKIFEQRLLTIAENLGKKTIVWQEVFDLGIPIANDTIVDVWKDWGAQAESTLHKATAAGYSVILSSCWYLDHLSKRWQDYYQCNPLGFNLTQDQQELVLGGHASMWGEHVDASNFMSRVWPRASAAAERLWTGAHAQAESTVAGRIQEFRCHMLRHGIMAGPTGPGSCDREPDFQSTTCEKVYPPAVSIQ
jgi:hexosaminidase